MLLSVLGALTFTRHTVGPSNYTHGVSAGDLDGDGDIDVVATARSDNQVYWYEWQGPDSFVRHPLLSVSQPIGVWCGDLDGDSDVDIAVAYSQGLSWLENDGSSNFTNHTIFSSASQGWGVSGADVDGDGDVDLLFTDWTGNSLWWFENTGGGFTQHQVDASVSGPHTVLGEDLDEDGDTDIILTSWGDGNVYWYENDGAQNFTRRVAAYTGGINSWDLWSLDIDGDGDVDVAVSNYSANLVWWLENDGAGTWTAHQIADFGGSVHGITAADFNGDGLGDVIAVGYSGLVKGYEGLGWTENQIETALTSALSVRPFDMDGDGDVDFVLGANTVYWYENTTPTERKELPKGEYSLEATGLRGAVLIRYSVRGARALEIYSASGRAIANLRVEGQGSLSLRLSPGVYVARLGSLSQRFTVLP